jgi:hypothetical protein
MTLSTFIESSEIKGLLFKSQQFILLFGLLLFALPSRGYQLVHRQTIKPDCFVEDTDEKCRCKVIPNTSPTLVDIKV